MEHNYILWLNKKSCNWEKPIGQSILIAFFIFGIIIDPFSSQNLIAETPNNFLDESFVVIEVTTDDFPDETKWSLINANDFSELFNSEDLNLMPNSTYRDSVVVDQTTCLRFIIEDSKEDGLSGNGGFQIVFNGQVVIENSKFRDNFSQIFNCSEGLACEAAVRLSQGTELLKDASNNWYRIRPIFDTYYSIRTISTCDTKLWLYDDCDNAHPIDQTGSILFNDDFQDKQAGFRQVFLLASRTYYLRVGNELECPGNSFIELIDLKLKSGCMDPDACNFDPLANLDSEDCTYGSCQPDIIVDHEVLYESIYIDSIDNESECLIEEGCLQGYGRREIIRFTTQIENIGDADYIIGEAEENSSLFSEDNCHQHWHYLGYAEYLIFDGNGSPQPVGFKNGFCALDYRCKDESLYKYSCDYMGITAGCYDTYEHDLLCQWIDVTDLPDGDYSLVVRVNYDRSPDIFGREESNYENNWAQVCLNLDRSTGIIQLSILEDCPVYEDCMGIQYGKAKMDCEGVCGGVAHFGDLTEDGVVDQRDVDEYKKKMIDQSIEVSSCLDLDADGNIDIYDLVLLDDCIKNNDTNESDPSHTHCDFPRSIVNHVDSLYLELEDFNTTERYIQLSYSSNFTLAALDLFIEGLNIDSITLEDKFVQMTSLSSEKYLSFIAEELENGVLKSKQIKPLLKIYYDSITEDVVCISNVVNAVNLAAEKTTVTYNTACLSFNTTSAYEESGEFSIQVFPNPSSDLLAVSGLDKLEPNSYFINNQSGQIISSGSIQGATSITLDLTEFTSGVYLLNLKSNKSSFICKFVKL